MKHGELVILHLINPTEKFWGVLDELMGAGVILRGINVNSFDEVPDSSWFTNRIGRAPMSVEEMKQGSCAPEDVLDPDAPDGTWLIDSGKPNGANPGFRIRLPDGRKYMLKSDLPIQPERTTGAAAIAGRLYHAAGWFVSCDTPVYLKPSILKLKPGLKVTDNQGMSRPFDVRRCSTIRTPVRRRLTEPESRTRPRLRELLRSDSTGR